MVNTDYPRISEPIRYVCAILLIVFFEGAVRKWLMPSATNLLVALRDILVIVYIYKISRINRSPSLRLAFEILILWTAIIFALGALQLMANDVSLTTLIIGFRFWILYVWFGVLISASCSQQDIVKLRNLIIQLMVLTAPIAIAQHLLPPSSWINQQPDTDEDLIFRVAGDVVRTTGTFSFSFGYTCFLLVALACTLAWLAEDQSSSLRIRLTVIAALLLSVTVSGSRGAIVSTLIIIGVFVASAVVLSSRGRAGSYLMYIVFAILAIPFVVLIFPAAISSITERFTLAADSEDVFERLLTVFIGEEDVFQRFQLLGFGIGAGSNFAGIASDGTRSFALSETEAGRILLEAGLLGAVLLIFKLGMATLGLLKSFAHAAAGHGLSMLAYWLVASVILITWPLSGQLSANALGLMLIGIALASSNFRYYAFKLHREDDGSVSVA